MIKKSIIDNDCELTVQNDLVMTIGNDSRVSITGNNVNTIEKEQITTVKADCERNILQDEITIVNENETTIVEADLVERIKGLVTLYVEKDAQEQYLQNLFSQVGQELGVDVTGAFELNAGTIKATAAGSTELNGASGISLKVGGNVLTVDASGIHFKTANYDANSGNGGVTSSAVSIEDLQKPLYEKLRVVGLEANLTKQDDITQELTYTAKVEKFSDGEWAVTTDLAETQKLQLNWFFIKNNDEMDTEVVTDNPTDDDITIDGLTIKVTLQDDSLHRFGHAHCFVNSPDDEEGHAVTELKRQLDVEEVLGRNLLAPSATEVNYRVELNIDNPTLEELKTLKVKIDSRDSNNKHTLSEIELDDSLVIIHPLENEHTIQEIQVHVYPEDKEENGAQAVTYGRLLEDEETTNMRVNNEHK